MSDIPLSPEESDRKLAEERLRLHSILSGYSQPGPEAPSRTTPASAEAPGMQGGMPASRQEHQPDHRGSRSLPAHPALKAWCKALPVEYEANGPAQRAATSIPSTSHARPESDDAFQDTGCQDNAWQRTCRDPAGDGSHPDGPISRDPRNGPHAASSSIPPSAPSMQHQAWKPRAPTASAPISDHGNVELPECWQPSACEISAAQHSMQLQHELSRDLSEVSGMVAVGRTPILGEPAAITDAAKDVSSAMSSDASSSDSESIGPSDTDSSSSSSGTSSDSDSEGDDSPRQAAEEYISLRSSRNTSLSSGSDGSDGGGQAEGRLGSGQVLGSGQNGASASHPAGAAGTARRQMASLSHALQAAQQHGAQPPENRATSHAFPAAAAAEELHRRASSGSIAAASRLKHPQAAPPMRLSSLGQQPAPSGHSSGGGPVVPPLRLSSLGQQPEPSGLPSGRAKGAGRPPKSAAKGRCSSGSGAGSSSGQAGSLAATAGQAGGSQAVLVEEQRRKLEARIQSLGGQLGAEWYIKVRLRTGGKTAGQHDFHYYNGDNKAFLSMDQVARSLGLSVPVRSKAKDRRTPSKAERPAAVQAAGERPAKRQKNTPKPPVQPASYPFSTVEVECNGMPGVLHLAPPKWHIVCRCDTCLAASESGVKFPTGGERGFNVHAGKGPSKSWKRSVKIRLPGNAGTQDITTFMAAYNIRIPNTRVATKARKKAGEPLQKPSARPGSAAAHEPPPASALPQTDAAPLHTAYGRQRSTHSGDRPQEGSRLQRLSSSSSDEQPPQAAGQAGRKGMTLNDAGNYAAMHSRDRPQEGNRLQPLSPSSSDEQPQHAAGQAGRAGVGNPNSFSRERPHVSGADAQRAQQARSLSSARKSTGRAPSAAAAGGSGLTAKVPPVKTKVQLPPAPGATKAARVTGQATGAGGRSAHSMERATASRSKQIGQANNALGRSAHSLEGASGSPSAAPALPPKPKQKRKRPLGEGRGSHPAKAAGRAQAPCPQPDSHRPAKQRRLADADNTRHAGKALPQRAPRDGDRAALQPRPIERDTDSSDQLPPHLRAGPVSPATPASPPPPLPPGSPPPPPPDSPGHPASPPARAAAGAGLLADDGGGAAAVERAAAELGSSAGVGSREERAARIRSDPSSPQPAPVVDRTARIGSHPTQYQHRFGRAAADRSVLRTDQMVKDILSRHAAGQDAAQESPKGLAGASLDSAKPPRSKHRKKADAAQVSAEPSTAQRIQQADAAQMSAHPSTSQRRQQGLQVPGQSQRQDPSTSSAADALDDEHEQRHELKALRDENARLKRDVAQKDELIRSQAQQAQQAQHAQQTAQGQEPAGQALQETLAAAQQQIEALQRELALEKRLAEQVLEEERAQSAAELQRLKERNAQLMRKNLELQAG